MKNVYIQNEAKNNFKDWSKQGLEFLSLNPWLSNNIKIKVQKIDIFISIDKK